MAIATGSWAEDQPYAAFSDNYQTLTFYYDGQKDERNGMSVGPFTNIGSRGWNSNKSFITKVVFDESFASYKPTSTALWFDGCSKLTTITGIENLKTDEVTNMEYMFRYCELTNLDLSSFNTAKVTDKTTYAVVSPSDLIIPILVLNPEAYAALSVDGKS